MVWLVEGFSAITQIPWFGHSLLDIPGGYIGLAVEEGLRSVWSWSGLLLALPIKTSEMALFPDDPKGTTHSIFERNTESGFPRCLRQTVRQQVANNPLTDLLYGMNILTIAAITRRKRINLCVDTCREMVRGGYEVHWRIIGNGPAKKILRPHAPPEIEWIDWVPTVGDQYEWADVFVLPSLDEGLGMVYAESVIHGTPFVCMAGQGGDEVIRLSGGGGVSVSDSWSYPQIVARLVGAIDYASCLKMDEKSRRAMEELFDLSTIKQAWSRIEQGNYDRLI